jgi:hypothetical protein
MNGNGMNFFGWIRDGVRQSVLLGVSDAVEQLGSPAPIEDLHPSVAGFLRTDASSSSEAPKLLADGNPRSRSRKRLGKSLRDIGANSTQPQEQPST